MCDKRTKWSFGIKKYENLLQQYEQAVMAAEHGDNDALMFALELRAELEDIITELDGIIPDEIKEAALMLYGGDV